MRSLERRYNNIKEVNPYWSSYTCYAETIREMDFSKRAISKYLNFLVDKDDYCKGERWDILKHLFGLTKLDRELRKIQKSQNDFS